VDSRQKALPLRSAGFFFAAEEEDDFFGRSDALFYAASRQADISFSA
jgi:hypothetical protein